MSYMDAPIDGMETDPMVPEGAPSVMLSATSRRREANNPLTPVTVRAVQQATFVPYENKFQFEKRVLAHVELIGVPTAVTFHPSDNSLVLELTDGTGSVTVTKIADENGHDEMQRYGRIENQYGDTYLRVLGRVLCTRTSPFSSQEERQVSAFSITPVVDHNMVTWHAMRVIAIHLSDRCGITRYEDDQARHAQQQAQAGHTGGGRFAQQTQQTQPPEQKSHYFMQQQQQPQQQYQQQPQQSRMQQAPPMHQYQQQQPRSQPAFGPGSGFPPQPQFMSQQPSYQPQQISRPPPQPQYFTPQSSMQRPAEYPSASSSSSGPALSAEVCFSWFRQISEQPQFADTGVPTEVREARKG